MMISLSYGSSGKHFVCTCTSVATELLVIEAASRRVCVRLHLQMQRWLQSAGSVTFGTFRPFGAADPNWHKREINKVRQ